MVGGSPSPITDSHRTQFRRPAELVDIVPLLEPVREVSFVSAPERVGDRPHSGPWTPSIPCRACGLPPRGT